MKQNTKRIDILLLAALNGAALTPALADPLDIEIGPAFPQPAYLGATTTVPITIEPSISTSPVSGVSAMISGGFSAQPVGWNFDLISHTCPGSLTPTTTPVRGVNWSGIETITAGSPIQCEIELRPRADLGTDSPVTLRVDCNGCTGDSDDRATTLVDTGVAGDMAVELTFNESQQVGTIVGYVTYSNIGLGEARNVVISMFGDPALFVDLEEVNNHPGCNENVQTTADSRSWSVSRVLPGESIQCVFNTTIPAPGSYDLFALVGSVTVDGLPDPWTDNDSDQVTMVSTEFVVDTRFSSHPDLNPGDGVCEDLNGNCSLRAAVEETNALPGRETILIPYEAGGYFLGGLSDYLIITDAVILAGLPDPTTGALPWITRTDSDDAGLIRISTQDSSPETELRNLDLRGNPNRVLTVDGAVVRQAGPTLLRNVRISGGETTGNGGGLRGGVRLRLRNVEIFDNHAGFGGGLYLTGLANSNVVDTSMIDLAVHDNRADASGGGLFALVANTTIDRSSFYSNTAVYGGGLYISSASESLITNSTIGENEAQLQGAGIYQVDNARRTTLDFVTLAFNRAGPGDTAVGDGGGIFVGGTSDVELFSSILAFNTARTTGGPFGTVVSGNCSGILTSGGNNTIAWIDGDPDCAVLTPRPTDSYNLAPGLSALETLPSGIAFYELIRVNNEIDRGSSSCVSAPLPYYARDNRFRIRPIDGDGDGFADCDRGAVEAGLFTLTVSTTTSGLPDWQIELDQDLPTCSDAACLYAAIPPGSFVTLTAVAQAGTVFEGWGGACASAGTGACTLDMTESRSVSAAFSGLEEFPLSVSVTGSGNVSSNPAGIDCPGTCVTDFLDGSLVTLTATPSTGFELASWSGACSGAGACQVTMNQARNVTATFQLTEVPLQVRMEGTGSGRVTSTPAGINCTSDCSASFPPATTIDLTATPDAGSTFQNWTGACSGTGTCRVTMSAATTVGVVWIDDESIFIDGME